MDAAPGVVSTQGDTKNEYNASKKESVMKETKGCGKVDDIVVMQFLLKLSACIGVGKGIHLITAPFDMEEGVLQGAVESSWIFSLGSNPASQRCSIFLVEHGGAMISIIDDNNINGPTT